MKRSGDRSASRHSGPLSMRLVAAILTAAAASHGRAGVIYDTTSSATLIDVDVSTSPTEAKQATLFHTTASEFVVTEASLQLRKDVTDPATGGLNWLIYTDAGGQPNLPISGGILFTLDTSSLSGAYATVSTGSLSVTLSPSTDYWLVLNGESMDGGIVQVQEALNPSGVAAPFKAMTYRLGAWTGHSNQAMVGTITAVPEPSVWVMAIAGLGLAGVSMRCRRKQA